MHPAYLSVSLVALVLGVACFLSPEAIKELAKVLDRSVGKLEVKLLKRRSFRYGLGLLLFLLSFGMFRLAYLAM